MTTTKPRVRVHADGRQELISFPALPATNGGKGAPSATYMRGNDSPYFFSWTPALRDQRDDIVRGYTQAAARAIDGLHNSGWIAGAVEQSIGSTVGTGLRLSSKPDFDLIGWTAEQSNTWARMVERRWEAWACNPVECDAGGKASMSQMVNAAMRSYFSHGEAVGLLPIVRRSFSSTQTKVKILPAHKLTTDSDNIKMFQGVLMDDWGFPRAYRMRLRLDGITEETIDVKARDAAGRPQVFHIFDPEPDCPRGITPMAPVLRIVRQYDQLADATLTQALIQAIFAATIQSEAPTEQILNALQDEDEQMTTQGVGPGGSIDNYLEAKSAWYQNTKIDLGRSGRIAHLFPGEELEFHASSAPNATYEAFAKFLLREIARCLGMTFETLTGDYSGATYSSVRMATSEIWPVILRRRSNIGGRFYQIVFEAWLEEEIERGRIPFKSGFEEFLTLRNAVSRADWRGPPKPQADDLKSAKAHEIYKRLGLLSDDAICSELGFDWEDVYEQRGREKAMREKLGLPETDTIEPPGETGDRLDDLDR